MRSKNSKPKDALESAYLADVKRCACVICNAPPPSAAHHPEQELDFNTIALCWDCHQGPHGWHGDKSRWRAAKMTEAKAQNETKRRVEELRAGKSGVTLPKLPPNAVRWKVVKPNLSSSKILPRRDT